MLCSSANALCCSYCIFIAVFLYATLGFLVLFYWVFCTSTLGRKSYIYLCVYIEMARHLTFYYISILFCKSVFMLCFVCRLELLGCHLHLSSNLKTWTAPLTKVGSENLNLNEINNSLPLQLGPNQLSKELKRSSGCLDRPGALGFEFKCQPSVSVFPEINHRPKPELLILSY